MGGGVGGRGEGGGDKPQVMTDEEEGKKTEKLCWLLLCKPLMARVVMGTKQHLVCTMTQHLILCNTQSHFNAHKAKQKRMKKRRGSDLLVQR